MITIGGRAHTLDEVHAVGILRLPFVEISMDDPGTVKGWKGELLGMRGAYGIRYLAHFPNEDNPFDVRILKDRFVPKIKALIDLAGDLDIPKATMHFWIDRRWAPQDLIPKKLELLADIVEYASSSGVIICIENLSERFESFQSAFDIVPDLMMTLDIGHAQLLAKRNTSYDFIEHCGEKIAHVHVHDNRGGTSVKDDLHLALGEGNVEYRAILHSLLKSGYDSTITMEVKPEDMSRTKVAIEGCLGPGATS